MDITKIMRPNRNNVILTLILLFLTSLPTYEISLSGIFNILQVFVQTKSFANGLPLPYLVSTSKAVLFFIPGGTIQSIIYVNLFADIIFWFIISSLICWKYFRGKRK
jgi:hypothetical protein